MTLWDWIPPILSGRFEASRRRPPEVYASYTEALAASSGGYGDPRVARVVCEKTRRYRDALASQRPLVCDPSALWAVLALNLRPPQDTTWHVLDFGGACGAHYFWARAWLGDRVRLRWHVVESPAMVVEAVRLEEDGLRVFDRLDAACAALGRVDLVFSSGALPYLPDPAATLQDLTARGALAICLTRLVLTTGPRDLIICSASRLRDNGPGPLPAGWKDGPVSFPLTVLRRDRVEAILAERYTIQLLSREHTQPSVVDSQPCAVYGFLGVLKPV